MKKRILAGVLGLTMLLTACGGGNENGAPGEEAADQEEGYVPGGGLGYLGDTMHPYWFDFTVEDA